MLNYSIKMADSMIERYPRMYELKIYNGKWTYDYGVVLKGFEMLYRISQDEKYFNYIKDNLEPFIHEDGSIERYSAKEFNIDHINNGKLLFLLYEKTQDEKYFKALQNLRGQLDHHPRTSEGAFWHKEIYPYQIWLDGLYMGAPFYLEYTLKFEDGKNIDDVTKQFIICAKHTLDKETNLLYHAWDEKREQFWADKETGLSENFWGRSLGWYLMAIVDVLEMLPHDHQDYDEVVGIYQRTMEAVVKFQSEEGAWYQVLNMPGAKGNYLEASASSMFVYALSKGLRLGILDQSYQKVADKAYNALYDVFILETKEGWLNLNKNCEVAGLGGADMRDGSYTYYISEPIINNDFKGVGAYLKATAEYEGMK